MFAIEMPVLPMRSSSTASLKSSRVIRPSLRSVLERSSCDQDKETCAVSLSRMVANFMEESDMHRRSAQHIAAVAASQEEDDDSNVIPTNTIRTLKELVRCTDAWERKILEETRKLVMAAKMDQVHDAKMIKVRVTDGLWNLGFNASLCISKWDRTPRHPHGHHEYIDVITDDSLVGYESYDDERRIIVDLELRSEFDVARSTRRFASLLNAMPEVFVGRPERLRRVVSMMADAAVKSLKRQEFHVPPWRRPDYMLCKWFSPFTRCGGHRTSPQPDVVRPIATELRCARINDPRLGERSSMVGLENDEDGGDDGLSSMSSSEEEEEFNGWRWNPRPPLALMQRRKVFAGLTATQIL